MQNKRILLVEDNPDDVTLIKRVFATHRIDNDIEVAEDGELALDYLFRRGRYEDRPSGMPQVVLLDLKLPKLNGIEVLTRIRSDKRTRLLPVVILTSSSEESDMLNGYAAGVNSYVRKPVDFREFSDALHQIGLYWLILNKQPVASEGE